MTKEELAAARYKYCEEAAQKSASLHADAARWRYVRDHSIRGTQDTKTTWSWHFTPRGFAASMEALVDMHMAREEKEKKKELHQLNEDEYLDDLDDMDKNAPPGSALI